MKVILTADVYKHGVAGEVVDVANGFARNYLIPQGLAMKATAAALQQHEELRETAATRKAALEKHLNELAFQIDGTELIFGRRAGSNGKLYGSVTTMDIVEALNEKAGVDINRRRISQNALRELGVHDVTVRLGADSNPKLVVYIVREEDVEAAIAARERGDQIASDGSVPLPPEPEEAEAVGEEEVPPELAADEIEARIEEAEAVTEPLPEVEAETGGDEPEA